MEANKRKEAIERLLTLLTDGDFKQNPEKNAILTRCIMAAENPEQYVEEYNEEYSFLLDDDPEKLLEMAIFGEVIERMFFGDKADELHEQIQDQFEEALPDYPYDTVTYADEYYDWLKEQLEAIDSKFVPALFACSYSDELQIIIVRKQTVTEISMLCEDLDIHFESLFEFSV